MTLFGLVGAAVHHREQGMPSIFSFGLICRLTFAMDCISRSRPLAERNEGWDWMITLSVAASELIGIIPSDGNSHRGYSQ